MATLLIESQTFQRLESELKAIDPHLSFVLLNSCGIFTRDGKPVDMSDVHPDVAWLNVDLARANLIKAYVDTVLAAGTVKWLQTFNAGLDNPFYKNFFAAGIRITNSNAQSIPMAEYVIANILAHYQNVERRKLQQKEHQWQRTQFRELWRTRWLLIGFGNIGQALAQRLRGFECEIIGVRRNVHPHPLADRIISLEEVPSVLPTADVVVIACALTEETQGLANKCFFERMRSQAILINVARGKIVDQDDLIAALNGGLIEHAILDVVDPEPLPKDNPIWEMANVTLTGHTSNFGNNTRLRGDQLFLENLRRYLAREPLLNEVPATAV